MKSSTRYGLLGALVGLGAPIGAVLLRLLFGQMSLAELLEHRFFYVYMAICSPLTFALFGIVLGRLVQTLEKGRESFRRLSNTDELTGLPNRRAFDAAYVREVARAQRSGSSLACLVLDVDRFKRFNDDYGHAAGDEVLCTVGRVLARVARVTDVPARIGGDEFALLAPDTSIEDSRSLALRIQRELQDENVLSASPARRLLTVTIGSSAATGPDAEDLLSRADQDLFCGKRSRGIER